MYTLATGKRKELPILAKYLEGFLDDGPQFVLRLIVFVLYGLGREGLDKGRCIWRIYLLPTIYFYHKHLVKDDKILFMVYYIFR